VPVVAQSNYKPPLFCSNPHVQTVVPTMFRNVPGVTYQRERIETPDGDFLDLDWSRVRSKRLAIVLHGLEGDSGRPYMMGMVRALNRNGWDSLAMNFRGCSGEPNRNLRMYHSGETEDLHTVICHVAASGIYARLALVGFSLGGNAILKYLGERGDSTLDLIKAAVTISVPCDLKGCSVRLEELGNRLYLKRFLKMLRQKIRAKALVMPESIDDVGYDRIRTLKEFDDRYTAQMHGFKDADDYYEKSSSRNFLSTISVPTLLINAADDPFLSASCFPTEDAKANRYLFLEIPQHGGHVGFMTFDHNGEYWSETRATSFLATILQDLA
jgi:predicted alpha/beta-fold hydrolase